MLYLPFIPVPLMKPALNLGRPGFTVEDLQEDWDRWELVSADQFGEFSWPDELWHPIYNCPVVSHSMLGTFDRCAFAFYLSYVEGWKGTEFARPLDLGGKYHEFMAVYESGGTKDDRNALIEKWLASPDLTGPEMEAIGTSSWMMDRYVEWAPSADVGRRTLKFNGELMIEFHFEVLRRTPKGRLYIIQGYIDKVYADENQNIWVCDTKTFSKTSISEIEAMMDIQLPMYASALNSAGLNVFGLEFNSANSYNYKDKSSVPMEKLFVRLRTHRTPQEMDNVLQEVGKAVDEITDRDVLHPRRSMRRDCNRCQFVDPCLYGLKGIPINDVLEGEFVKKEKYRNV